MNIFAQFDIENYSWKFGVILIMSLNNAVFVVWLLSPNCAETPRPKRVRSSGYQYVLKEYRDIFAQKSFDERLV